REARTPAGARQHASPAEARRPCEGARARPDRARRHRLRGRGDPAREQGRRRGLAPPRGARDGRGDGRVQARGARRGEGGAALRRRRNHGRRDAQRAGGQRRAAQGARCREVVAPPQASSPSGFTHAVIPAPAPPRGRRRSLARTRGGPAMLWTWFAAVGGGSFVVVGAFVSVRLLLLWRRTRQLPQLLLGLGLGLSGAIGSPVSA